MPDPILAEVLNLVASEDGLGRIERIRWVKFSLYLKLLGAYRSWES
jgi:hypothetical protein